MRKILYIIKTTLKSLGIFILSYFVFYFVMNTFGLSKQPIMQKEFNQASITVNELENKNKEITIDAVRAEGKKEIDGLKKTLTQLSGEITSINVNISALKSQLK